MKSKNNNLSKLERAQKKVKDIKDFYNHAVIYVIVNIILLLFRKQFVFTLLSADVLGNPDFLRWINWNVFGTPIIWGIALAIHGLSVFDFKPNFLKDWEEKQIQKYIKEED